MRGRAGVAAVAALVCGATAGADAALAPELPRITEARVVVATKFGTAVRMAYCYASLPRDARRRPARLVTTLDNRRDALPPSSRDWPVTTRCGTVVHSVAGVQQPYVLRYATETRGGVRSQQGLIRLAARPELARKPPLPATLTARVVDDTTYGHALRISYCFESLSRDPSMRPARLSITLVSTSNRFALRSYSAPVTNRCDTVVYPLAGMSPPFVLYYGVRSVRGTVSKRAQMTVR